MRSGIALLSRLTAISALLAGAAIGKQPITFTGRVLSVDLKLLTVAIQHGPIPGYMPAMTMDYPVDNSAILRRLAPADEITATVYVGDPVLHDVHVARHAGTPSQGAGGTSSATVRPSKPAASK